MSFGDDANINLLKVLVGFLNNNPFNRHSLSLLKMGAYGSLHSLLAFTFEAMAF